MRDARRDRLLLVLWLVAAFGLSALRDVELLAVAAVISLVVFWRGVGRNLTRTLRLVVPLSVGLSLASMGLLRLTTGVWAPIVPFTALVLRVSVIGFVSFAVLDRVRLLRALEPFPLLTKLLVVTLAQIHALRLLATESRDGLRSRLPRRPAAFDVLRNSGGITAMLFTLSARNAGEISDAMRSRGF
jgi:cobalt/nickel transport system permease protein